MAWWLDLGINWFQFTQGTTLLIVTIIPAVDGAILTLSDVPEIACDTQYVESGVAVPASANVIDGHENGVGIFTATCSGAVDKAGDAARWLATLQNTHLGGLELELELAALFPFTR